MFIYIAEKNRKYELNLGASFLFSNFQSDLMIMVYVQTHIWTPD